MPHSLCAAKGSKGFSCTKVHLAKQSEVVLQQLATFMAMIIGKSNPLTVELLRQLNDMSRKYSKGAEFKMHT